MTNGLYCTILLKLGMFSKLERVCNSNQLCVIISKIHRGETDKITLDALEDVFDSLKSSLRMQILSKLTQAAPYKALGLIHRHDLDTLQAYFCRLYFEPETVTSQSIEKKLRSACNYPRSCFNLYNYFMHFDEARAFGMLDTYFIAVGLQQLAKVDCRKPLYIDNVCINTRKMSVKNGQKVSIVMTAYNESELIVPATRSLMEQTYKNIEIIFVDDASSDDTVKLFTELCRQESFTSYKVISIKQRSGPFVTRNIGIKHAAGEYITFHDADDWSHPERLQEQMKKNADKQVVASISQLVRIKPNGQFFAKNIYPIKRVSMVSLMIKRDVFCDLGYFYTDVIGADSEYFERIKIFYGMKRIGVVKKVLTFAAHRKNSQTTSADIGTPEFGINPKRVAHWEIFRERQSEMVEGKRSFFVPFES
ncbi:MAG: hypothetical protein DIZ78_09835 [endosymbiont of Escarpia spicata]|uniref:Glycosyltransferase 2-like domain-containing protein n=1 Tax=endosymbiont of Escarpia spicata TaxID=2200908 RepID=A0A370DNB8_9GAMM|nr:MAG: hypothetical protein DIZ78_09835 [endosymbiont of Escarpia spicata]